LIETANIVNPTDRDRLADPWWRQQFAHAYVDALKRHFAAGGLESAPEAIEAD
jgi:N-acetylmuramoyl-L-alanine amidase